MNYFKDKQINLFSPENLGYAIRNYRRSKGVKSRELAQKAGINQSTLSFIERNKRKTLPDPSTLQKIFEALDISFGYFFVINKNDFRRMIEVEEHGMPSRITTKSTQKIKG